MTRTQTLDKLKQFRISGKTHIPPSLVVLVNKFKITDEEIDEHEIEEEEYREIKIVSEKIKPPQEKKASVTERRKKRVNVYLSVEGIEKIQSIAYKDRTSVSAMIEQYIKSL